MLNPNAIRRRAKELFSAHFSNGDRETWQIPEDHDPSERAGLDELARLGLVIKKNGGYRLGDRGVEVCMGELDLDIVLSLATRPAGVSGARLTVAEDNSGSRVSVTYVNNGQVAAMGPHAIATANTFEQESAPPAPDAEHEIEADTADVRRLR